MVISTKSVVLIQAPLLLTVMASAFLPRAPTFATSRRHPHREQGMTTHIHAKNFFDEILDGLDTMAGISPLAESDLKGGDVDLVKRAKERDEAAPPPDALKKPSVSIFFFLLGFVPVVLSILAINAGFRPLGL